MFDFFRKWLGATRNRVRQDPIGLPIFRRDPLKQRVLRLEIRACNQIPRLPDLVEGIDAVRLVRIAPSPEPDSKEMAGVADIARVRPDWRSHKPRNRSAASIARLALLR